MHTLLDSVRTPGDLRKLSVIQLTQLAAELRDFVLHTTQTKAGHIKSSLGVTELTLALHYVYNTPDDILIWDVGHQAYIHKILTGRKDKFHSNRKKGGLSGFTKRSESEYDPFGAGHSSTSISAAIGFAEADRLQGKKRHYIAVIGDGALTGGESLEALNYLGERQLNVTVILNDNQSSIDANVGALAHFGNYKALCDAFHLDFEGGVDGHSVEKIINSLSRSKEVNRPKMIHLVTQKGKGWKAGSGSAKATNSLSFQDVFSQTLIRLAETNDTIVGVSPAMLSGSG
ncbi:MAG TPA: 1-deoxy-D-xylulose-5-phosphate synthase, partial [Cryomorphaceae bacterium]|nr:1-deoxy-D-xylulose-5-phosphate synthase [Cryomorphaceae bacterium]